MKALGIVLAISIYLYPNQRCSTASVDTITWGNYVAAADESNRSIDYSRSANALKTLMRYRGQHLENMVAAVMRPLVPHSRRATFITVMNNGYEDILVEPYMLILYEKNLSYLAAGGILSIAKRNPHVFTESRLSVLRHYAAYGESISSSVKIASALSFCDGIKAVPFIQSRIVAIRKLNSTVLIEDDLPVLEQAIHRLQARVSK